MEESQILSSLTWDDTQLIKRGLLGLQDMLTKNNGVLVIRDLIKLKNGILSIMQKFKNGDDNEVLMQAFDFLVDFMANNYGSDMQIQFICFVVPEVIKLWLTLSGKVMENAEDALWAYIRDSKELEIVLNILTTKHLSTYNGSQDSPPIIKCINLAIKNIEFHPKIISAKCKSFIDFIEWLIMLKMCENTDVSTKANTVLMNFIKRFPATIKEISNDLESRDISGLTDLIKLRNESLTHKKIKKQKQSKLGTFYHPYKLL
jgi:hypothetical protein